MASESQDLNPADYQISVTMQTAIHSVDGLKQRLTQFWCNPDQDIINTATD